MFPILDTREQPGPFEAGLFHGQNGKERVLHSLAAYRNLFAQCGLSWQQAQQRARAFEPIMRDEAPDSIVELQGIASGAGVEFLEILALNCRSELLTPELFAGNPALSAAALQDNRSAGYPDWNECTSFAVSSAASSDGTTWLAQNWDWLGTQRQALIVLKGRFSAEAGGRSFTTLTEAGMLAKIGVNGSGMAVGLNILRSREDGLRPGIAVHWLLRQLLSCGSVEEADQLIDRLQRQYGFGGSSNIISADAHGSVASFELSAMGAYARIGPDAHGLVRHTNHFLADALQSHQADYAKSLSTETRLQRAHELSPSSTQFDRAMLEAALRDTGADSPYTAICRYPDPSVPVGQRVESVAGVIINTHRRQMWVAPDIPAKTQFEQVGHP